MFTRSDGPRPVKLHADVYEGKGDVVEPPIVITHGTLGSGSNWTSLAKAIALNTGRTVATLDARNHGKSPHIEEMSYEAMAQDVIHYVRGELGIVDSGVSFVGHSMGGRTAMCVALNEPDLVKDLVVVDVSPVNRDFDVSDDTEWNMAHFFHAMLNTEFPQGVTMSEARKAGDKQLSKRIHDPFLRAWLLMNVDELKDGTIGWKINVQNIYDGFKNHIGKYLLCSCKY